MTDRTTSPSQDNRGTARLLINSSASKEVEKLVAALARAERAEAERDAWIARFNAEDKRASDLAFKAGLAEAELDALKAMVAEVLEPFVKAHDQWIAAASPDVPDDHELNVMGSTVGHFRRAAELHATLSGERT